MIFSAPAGKGREDKLVFYGICRKLRRPKVIVLPASVISGGIFNIKRESVTTAGKTNRFKVAAICILQDKHTISRDLVVSAHTQYTSRKYEIVPMSAKLAIKRSEVNQNY